MTEIRFYHMMQKRLDAALPEIISKALERDYRIVIKAKDKDILKKIDKNLWTYKALSFIPHSMIKNGNESEQPIWLTVKDENPNKANMLLLVDGTDTENIDEFDLCCELFDGNDEIIVSKARDHWKEYKEKSYELSYFQQDDLGKWQKKQ